MEKMRWIKKGISALLALNMVLSSVPLPVFAAAEDNLCEHHPVHTAECHYAEAVAGSPCTHTHSEDCYAILACLHTCGDECEEPCTHECTVENSCVTMELDCHHTHGDCGYSEGTAEVPCGHSHNESCGYAEAVAGTPCANAETNPECDHTGDCGYVAAVEGQPCRHTEHLGCGYAPATEGTPCTHTHAVKVDSADSCYKLLCSHKDGGHDDACGYAAAVEAHDCHYECAECAAVPASEEPSEESSEPVPVCTCEAAEGEAHTENCALYVAPVEPVCDCGTDDALIHATTCAVYVAPENPVCDCAEKCTEVNEWCDVCGFDYTQCGGTDTAAVYAEGDVASVTTSDGTTTYYLMADALRTAVEDNKSDQAVTLLADIEILALRFFTENTTNTLNLNGHTLTGSNSNAVLIVANGCELTITGTGSINFTDPLMSANYEGSRIVVGSGVTLNNSLRSAYGGVLDLTNATIPEAGLNVILYTDDWKSATYNVSDVLLLPEDYYFFVDGKAVYTYSVETEGTVLKHTEHSYTYTDNGDGTHKYECTICGDNVIEAHKGGTATCTEKAECQHCGASYGEVDTTNHDSSVAFDSNGFCPNGCYQPAELKDGYYQIKNAGNLYWFAQQVNGGNGAINGKLTTNIVVNQNVLVNGALNSNTDGFRVWTPIGYWNSSEDLSYYVGTFDGAGFTVSGLYHNDSTKSRIGLFGAVSANGIVKNVGVVDSYFCGKERVGGVVGSSNTSSTVQNCYNTGIVSGNANVGGVVGYNYEGTVQNCYNMGAVRSDGTAGGVVGLNWGGLVTNCHNTGAVKGGDETGGVVGYMISSSVELCYNTGTVNGKKYVGGIFGSGSGGNAKNCYNTGMVSGSTYVGGVVGYISSGTVENCYNANSVSGSSSVGGVVGKRYDSKTGITTNSYFDSTKYSGSAIGGNDAGAATVKGKTTEQFASGEVAYLLGEAFGQNIGTESYPLLGGTKVYYGYNSCGDTEKKYTNDENTSEEKPAHTGEATYTLTEDGKQHIANWSCCGTEVTEDHTGGTATCKELAKCEHCGVSYGELDPNNHEYEKNNGICCETYQPAELNESGYYEIGNAGQLFWFAQQVNVEGNREIKGVLTADIDLENRPWTPIGETGENNKNFRGVFDGQNHIIKGLYVEGDRAGLGFFGEVRTGTVKNFTIYGEVVVNTEVDYVGGVIGSICGVNGETDLERNGAIIQNITSYVNLTAKAHGVGMIGGFVGYANHQSLIENCSWYGTFDAGIYRVDSGAGGFIGKIQENTSEVTIRNCAAYGTIKTNYAGDYNNTATIYMGGFLSFSNTGAKTVLENCLFAGKFERGENLTDQAFLGAFGTLRSVNAIKNCYYLGDGVLEAVHSDSPLKPGENIEITSVTGEQLKSGEVAYLLQEANEIWGQTIGTQNYPVLGGDTVYQVLNCKNENAYSNTYENLGHNYVNGTCTVCGASQTVVSVDISWGAMEFTYTDGEWQPKSHTYADGKWTPDVDGGNVITVENKGNVAVNASFAYTKTVEAVNGSFTLDGTNPITEVALEVNGKKEIYLLLTGKPNETNGYVTLGTITVTITTGGE